MYKQGGYELATPLVVRIPPEIRQEMLKFKLNWSEEVRKAIIERINQLKREQSYKEMDQIHASMKGRRTNATEEVLRWRRPRW
jgi:hypothetical protein